MFFFVAAHLVKASQNISLEKGTFFLLFAINSQKILIAEFFKSRKVFFVALEIRQISSIKRPLIPEMSIIKLILNRYDQWIQYRHICEKGPKAEHQKLAKMCKRNVQYPTE